MPTTTTALADRIVEAMRGADWSAIVAMYAPDVLIDINSPQWRFQLQGRDAAAQWFDEQLAAMKNLRLTDHRVHRSERGVVIEEEMAFDMEGSTYKWRAADIFTIDGDAITEHVQYCTGVWDPDQIERHRHEAPMVRW